MRRLAVALVLVAAACGSEGGSSFDAGTPLATTSTTTSSTTTTTTTLPTFIETAATVDVNGELPRFGEAPDPAQGMRAPTVAGADFAGSPVEIAPSDTYKVIMFLAHWCPHCQDEVKEIGPYLVANPPVESIEVLAVSTGVDPDRPNYPPSEWLTLDAWPTPVLVDTAESSVAAAFGLNAYPFWVVLDPDGVVLARSAGSLPLESVEALFDNLAALEG
ncbi:MAG: TlpA family protein disulfide reductase [Acidimicrobiales bacterium]|nr:TlpA family protein disulfide reductase [Acidimicrobiales bacterium]